MAAMRTLSDSMQRLGRLLLPPDNPGVSDAELVGRFVERREEAAFAALVRRHGTLVFGVCRRVLRHQQDAEDAFQATFLVLARNAAQVQRKGAVANWLYGVAHNVARKARTLRARRVVKEKEAASRQRTETSDDGFDDLHEIIDRELRGLPDRYRTPIVLCDLQGLTTLEAAAELGCPAKTVGTRLSRGRALLAQRLTRRGVALPVGGLAATLLSDATAIASPELLHATVQTAIGGATVAPSIAALTAGATNIMLVTSMKLGLALTLGSVALIGLSHGPVRQVVQAHTTGAARAGGNPSTAAASPPVISLDDIHGFIRGLLGIHLASADDKEKAPLSGEWAKKDSDVKLAFEKDGLKISPHGKDDLMLIVCEYKREKDGVVKAKITGHEGSKKEVIAEKLPVGTEFSFKWKPNKDAATLDEIKGDKIEPFKSHLEGEFNKK